MPLLPASDQRESPLWHPFTPMSAHRRDSVPEIVSGEGFELIDRAGVRYLDGISSLWCNLHGHRVPEIDAAIKQQVDRISHTTLLGLESEVSNEFARRLVDVSPSGLERVFFSDSGSTAVEAGLKIAWQYHQQKAVPDEGRTLFATVSNAYHGDTVGSVSVGAIDLFHSVYGPLLFKSIAVQSPARTCWHADRNHHRVAAFADLERTFRERGATLAAFVIEPLVQGAAGILVHPNGYLRRVRALCDEYDVPLIADEVAVGFGRTGSLFACEQEDVSPDIMCLAKGITAGYLPLAATLTTEEIYKAFLGEPHEGRTFFHGHTYTGNPLACAAGIASLDLIEANRTVEAAQGVAQTLARKLKPLESREYVGQVRQKGTMVGIELVANRQPMTPFPAELRLGHQVVRAARKRNTILRPLGDVIVLMPAPAMPLEMVEHLVDVTVESIDEAATEALATVRH